MSKPVKAYVASFVPKKKEDAVRGNLVKKAAAPAATAGAKKAVAPAALAAPAVAKKSIDPHVNKASAGKKAGSIKTDEQKVDSVSSAEDALKKMQLKTQGKLQEQDAAEAAKRKKELDAANAAKKKKEQAENKDFSYGPSGGMLVPLPGKDDIMSKDGEMQSIQYSGSRGGRPLANKPKTQRLIFTPSDVDQSILIHLTELNNVLDWCKQQGKVPLLMDTSGQVDIFFTYNNATIIDAKKLFVSLKVVKNMTMEDCLEELRKKTVAAMKYGHKLILALTNTVSTQMHRGTNKYKYVHIYIYTCKHIHIYV